MAKFNKLDVPHQWKDEFTKYPHGYTIFEALCKWVKQVDNMVDNINNWNDYLDIFVENFGPDLQNEVQNTITKWQNEGLLDGIIESALNTELDIVKTELAEKANNEDLQTTNNVIINLSNSINSGLDKKIDKNGAGQVTWANIAQDVREQITGGNTAVVGIDSVLSENIANKAVTLEKRTSLGNYGLIYSSTGIPNFDFNTKTLTIPRLARLAHGNTFHMLDDGTNDVVINLVGTSSTYGILMFNTNTTTFRVRQIDEITIADEDEILIAVYSLTNRFAYMAGVYTVDGKIPNGNKTVGLTHLDDDTKKYIVFNDISSDDFEWGTINSASGGQNVEVSRPTTIRHRSYKRVSKNTVIKNNNVSECFLAIWFYSAEDKTWLSDKTVGFGSWSEHTIDGDYYIRLVAAFKDYREFTDFDVLLENFEFIRPIADINHDLKAVHQEIKEISENTNDGQPQYVNDTGKEFIFKFPITSTYMSDHTFVGDELWTFPVSNDEHTNWNKVRRYQIDYENKSAMEIGSFDHNWGHCNTVDYCEKTDSLIVGNGGGSSNIQPDEVYIFENASSFKNRTQVDVSEAITLHLNVDGFEWGKQINAVWGQSNGGKHNIAYVISNYNAATGEADTDAYSSDTQVIHKILLGQGSNSLENGTFITGKTGLQFNGTYKVLKEYTHPYEYDYANQGTQFYNGVLYEGISHDRVSVFEKILCDDGVIRSRLIRERMYDDLGNEINFTVEGVAIKDDYLFIGNLTDTSIYVYKL